MSGGRGSSFRVAGGAEAFAEGKYWEKVIATQLETARQANLISWFEHTQAGFRRVNAKLFLPVRQGPADFVGMFNGGLTFAVEVKSHKWTPEHPRFDRVKILPAQVAHLDATSRGEGVALLALEFRYPDQPRRHFVVPWREIPWMRAKTADSLPADALVGWELDWPLFLRKFGKQCPKCLQVRQVRRYSPGHLLAFCHCGIFDETSSQLPLPILAAV